MIWTRKNFYWKVLIKYFRKMFNSRVMSKTTLLCNSWYAGVFSINFFGFRVKKKNNNSTCFHFISFKRKKNHCKYLWLKFEFEEHFPIYDGISLWKVISYSKSVCIYQTLPHSALDMDDSNRGGRYLSTHLGPLWPSYFHSLYKWMGELLNSRKWRHGFNQEPSSNIGWIFIHKSKYFFTVHCQRSTVGLELIIGVSNNFLRFC